MAKFLNGFVNGNLARLNLLQQLFQLFRLDIWLLNSVVLFVARPSWP
jgi:hypothetical protein